jgi:hypothetical protein
VGNENMDWNERAKNRSQWRNFVNALMNFQVAQMQRIF